MIPRGFLIGLAGGFLVFLGALAVFFPQDGGADPWSAQLTGAQAEEMAQLQTMLQGPMDSQARRFSLVTQVGQLLTAEKKLPEAGAFYAAQARNFPGPEAGVFLFQAGEIYRSLKAWDWAAYYYQQVVSGYPDQIFRGESLHYQALDALGKTARSPYERQGALRALQQRFPDAAAGGLFFYNLGKAQEETGQWKGAMEAYTAALTFPSGEFQSSFQARERIQALMDFYKSDKSWVNQDLESLVAQVKAAVLSDDPQILEALRAEVNFFAKTWDAPPGYSEVQEGFDPAAFMREIQRLSHSEGRSVAFDKALIRDSGGDEALLGSQGWYYRAPVWYFYFRRIHYPVDPAYNGAWEWGGVYWGKRP